MLHPSGCFSNFLLDPFQIPPCRPQTGGPRTEQGILGAASPVPSRNELYLPSICWPCSYQYNSQHSMQFALLLRRAHNTWALIQFGTRHNPQGLSKRAATQPITSQPMQRHAVAPGRCQALHLTLLNSEVSSSPILSSVEVPLVWSTWVVKHSL